MKPTRLKIEENDEVPDDFKNPSTLTEVVGSGIVLISKCEATQNS